MAMEKQPNKANKHDFAPKFCSTSHFTPNNLLRKAIRSFQVLVRQYFSID